MPLGTNIRKTSTRLKDSPQNKILEKAYSNVKGYRGYHKERLERVKEKKVPLPKRALDRRLGLRLGQQPEYTRRLREAIRDNAQRPKNWASTRKWSGNTASFLAKERRKTNLSAPFGSHIEFDLGDRPKKGLFNTVTSGSMDFVKRRREKEAYNKGVGLAKAKDIKRKPGIAKKAPLQVGAPSGPVQPRAGGTFKRPTRFESGVHLIELGKGNTIRKWWAKRRARKIAAARRARKVRGFEARVPYGSHILLEVEDVALNEFGALRTAKRWVKRKGIHIKRHFSKLRPQQVDMLNAGEKLARKAQTQATGFVNPLAKKAKAGAVGDTITAGKNQMARNMKRGNWAMNKKIALWGGVPPVAATGVAIGASKLAANKSEKERKQNKREILQAIKGR